MAQPPAWLRHQAVEASARAMVSITWKKVTGSVSIPSDERGSSRRNSRASCSLSSRAGGSRRVLLDLVRGGRDRRPHGLGARDHGRVARKIGGSRDQRVQGHASLERSVQSGRAASSLSICSIDLPLVSMPKK